jgi:hypothetical protein
MRRVEPAAIDLHRDPEALGHDEVLLTMLNALYAVEEMQGPSVKVQRFLEQHATSLRTIYRRHADLRIAPCLDEFEGLLVLERLQNDRAHLAEAWPYSIDELQAVAEAAGVRLPVEV